MNQYRLFTYDKKRNLIYLGENIVNDDMDVGDTGDFEDESGNEVEWIVSEILLSHPKKIKRPDGPVYVPDPLVILKLK